MEPCLFDGFEEEKHLTIRAANCVQILLVLLCPQLLVPLLFLVTLVIHMPHILSISFFFFLTPPQPHWISVITLTPNPCLPGSHIALVMVSLLSETGFWSSLLHQACGQRKKTLLHNDVGLPGPHGHIQIWLSMIPQHLHTPLSPGTSLSCMTSPSSTDQLITHLQLPSQVCVSSGCSEKRHVISIPTAPADCSFQFTFRCSLCRLHPVVSHYSDEL